MTHISISVLLLLKCCSDNFEWLFYIHNATEALLHRILEHIQCKMTICWHVQSNMWAPSIYYITFLSICQCYLVPWGRAAQTKVISCHSYPSVEAVTMATFPARLLWDILLWPATGLVLRHLNTLLNITYGQRISWQHWVTRAEVIWTDGGGAHA